jgi:hypothetical protein
MKRILTYVSGAVALLIVTASVVAAVYYAALNGVATLSNLATSTLSGIGMAIGGCLGSALILRFKSARRYVAGVLKDVSIEKLSHPSLTSGPWSVTAPDGCRVEPISGGEGQP